MSVLCRPLALLGVVVCVLLGGCAPPVAKPQEPHATPARVERDPNVMELIEALDDDGPSVSMRGDEVVWPASFRELVRLGDAALPTITDVAINTSDDWTRDRLLDAIGRIRNPSSRVLLEDYLTSSNANTRSEALEALSRLGLAESQVRLRALLEMPAADSGFERMRLLEALYRVGDHSVLGEVIDIAMKDSSQEMAAVEILERHEPLRDMLGFEGELAETSWIFFDHGLLVRAANEWYLETQLGKRSPWKLPADFAFTEPYAAAKREAFAFFADQVAGGDDDFSVIRVLPVDSQDAAPEPATLVYGWGHGGSLCIDAFRVDGDDWRLHTFVVPRVEGKAGIYRTAVMTAGEYSELRAGMSAVLIARQVPWWSGPESGFSSSSGSFAVMLRGFDGEGYRSYSGFPNSSDRSKFVALCAVRDWQRRFAARLEFGEVPITADIKKVFSEVFSSTQRQWAGKVGWWWVRERMLTMAATFGDGTLVEPLTAFVASEFAEGRHGWARTATEACAALAAITGVELRFAEDGSALPVAAVAKAYREHFAK